MYCTTSGCKTMSSAVRSCNGGGSKFTPLPFVSFTPELSSEPRKLGLAAESFADSPFTDTLSLSAGLDIFVACSF